MDKMIVRYSILWNSGFGKFILKKKTATMNYELISKDYKYQQDSIVNKISSKKALSQHRLKLRGF